MRGSARAETTRAATVPIFAALAMACAVTTGCERANALRERVRAALRGFDETGGFDRGPAGSEEARFAGDEPDAPAGVEGGPERASGSDASREGASPLRVGTSVAGRVAFEEGDRTDWFRIEPRAPGLVQLDFSASEATGLEATLVDKGEERPLRASEVLEIFKPREVLVRVVAADPLARGDYRLEAADATKLPSSLKGLVLRFNGVDVTLDLGAEDGVRTGLRGVIVRKDSTQVPFVVTRVLRRTSRAETAASLGPEDLGTFAHVVGRQAALPGKAR